MTRCLICLVSCGCLLVPSAAAAIDWRSTLEGATQKAGSALNRASDAARNAADEARSRAGSASEQARQSVDRTVERTREEAERVGETVRHDVQRAGDQARTEYDNTKDRLKDSWDRVSPDVRDAVNSEMARVREDPTRVITYVQTIERIKDEVAIGALKQIPVYDPYSQSVTTVDQMARKMAIDAGLGGDLGQDPVRAGYLLMTDPTYLAHAKLIRSGNDWISVQDAIEAGASDPRLFAVLDRSRSVRTAVDAGDAQTASRAAVNLAQDIAGLQNVIVPNSRLNPTLVEAAGMVGFDKPQAISLLDTGTNWLFVAVAAFLLMAAFVQGIRRTSGSVGLMILVVMVTVCGMAVLVQVHGWRPGWIG